MESDAALLRHVLDLADRCYSNNHYTYTGFLSQGEQSEILKIEKELNYLPFRFYGGSEGCERQMLRFGSEEMLGYDEAFPIRCLKVSPLSEKYCDELTHRDFLGALMNLGIERAIIGDIIVRGHTGYVFFEESMSEYLCGNLNKVKHTNVKCLVCESCPEEAKPQFSSEELNISSGRCDAVIAGVFRLSRNKSQELFKNGNIFINGKQCENSSVILREGSTVSVRGYGKFIYDGMLAETRKGRIRAAVRRYT